jgi:phosphoribosylanthranilate isomerase
MRTRVKICCMASVAEAELAIKYGADAVGLVSAMPSGPGPIDEALIARIRARVPPPVATFLLTCRQDAREIVEQLCRTRCNTVQICDALRRGTYDDIRAAAPGVSLVQVIHVVDPGAIDEARRAAAHVDALLLDSGRPALAVKELGGTGRVHDWSISAELVRAVSLPVFLAGGLTPANVADAVRRVGPFGVDVCSGVRTDGRLDEAKLAAFLAAVRSISN